MTQSIISLDKIDKRILRNQMKEISLSLYQRPLYAAPYKYIIPYPWRCPLLKLPSNLTSSLHINVPVPSKRPSRKYPSYLCVLELTFIGILLQQLNNFPKP